MFRETRPRLGVTATPTLTAAENPPAVEQGKPAASISQLKLPMAVKVQEGDATMFNIETQPGQKSSFGEVVELKNFLHMHCEVAMDVSPKKNTFT